MPLRDIDFLERKIKFWNYGVMAGGQKARYSWGPYLFCAEEKRAQPGFRN